MSQSSPSDESAGLRGRIEELERQLDAKARTITTLTQRVEECADKLAVGGAYAVVEQNIALEHLVAEKVIELEQKRAALEGTLRTLQQVQTRLLQAQKLEAIGSLAAGVAHEINTPTQFVGDNLVFLRKGFVKLLELALAYREQLQSLIARSPMDALLADELKRVGRARLDYLKEEIPRSLEESVEGLGRIASIVRAMKDFSHPSSGELLPCLLANLLDTSVTVARNEWKYVAEIVRDYEVDMAPVPCLRDELGQVFLNLLVNAAQAIAGHYKEQGLEGKGEIRIATRTVGPYAEIQISDTGGGIPEAIQHRVFEPFFTTKPVGQGTGQGLAISYQVVVEKHRGSIEIETTPGVGTTFLVRLPTGAEAP